MTDNGDDAAEKPLDPATERLRRKLVRLLALSVSTLFVGVMAVLGAIVYKLNRDAPVADAPAAELSIALPTGSTLVEIEGAGDTALLRLRDAATGIDSLARIDLDTGAILARYRLEGLAPTPASAPASSAPASPLASPPTTGAPMLDLYRTP